jgi:hypothetical protein
MLGTLDTIISIVIVPLVLSLIVQSILSLIKKLARNAGYRHGNVSLVPH